MTNALDNVLSMGTKDGFEDFWGDDTGWSSSSDRRFGARRDRSVRRGRPGDAHDAGRQHDGGRQHVADPQQRSRTSDITGRIARIFDPSDAAGRRRHGDPNDPQWTQEIPAVDADATPTADREWDDLDLWFETQPAHQRSEHDAGRDATPADAADGHDDVHGGHRQADTAASDEGEDEEEWDLAAWEVEPATPPRRVGVDPLLAKLGVIAIVATLATPLFLSLRSGADDATLESAAETIAAPTISTDTSVVDTAVAAPEPRVSPSTAAPTSPAAAPTPAPSTAEVERADELAAPVDQDDATVALSDETTTRAASEATTGEQICAIDYDVVEGDFWLRLADGAGVPIEELLEANAASPDTPLYPGTTICLPAGSSTPPPPTVPATTAPPTTQAPTTTAAPTTTEAPAPATAPPTTAAPQSAPPAVTDSPGSNASPEQVQQIIRDIWPDELEDRAIEIARIESRWIPTADNGWCCHGVFQIYWTVHQGWLADFGVTSLEQLYDPVINTRMALEIYNRAGGWGPWGF